MQTEVVVSIVAAVSVVAAAGIPVLRNDSAVKVTLAALDQAIATRAKLTPETPEHAAMDRTVKYLAARTQHAAGRWHLSAWAQFCFRVAAVAAVAASLWTGSQWPGVAVIVTAGWLTWQGSTWASPRRIYHERID